MNQVSPVPQKPIIGLALGSGAARGWAHIGVLRELEACGVVPDIVCGTSIGAFVGALYVAGHLETLQDWTRQLDRREMLSYLDLRLLVSGGFVRAKALLDAFEEEIGGLNIADLGIPFGTVATDLATGHEIWLREGSLTAAVEASIALPGIFTPVCRGEQWLVDGGLVNPVPVSLCRAMGADVVIAVNLNGDIIGRHLTKYTAQKKPPLSPSRVSPEATLLDKLSMQLKHHANSFSQLFEFRNGAPGLFDVVASAINIMQFRITRSRMAGDPPDVLIVPRLAHLGLLEFGRSEEAIAEGRAAVRRSTLSTFLASLKPPSVAVE